MLNITDNIAITVEAAFVQRIGKRPIFFATFLKIRLSRAKQTRQSERANPRRAAEPNGILMKVEHEEADLNGSE
ncbi:hypothetical protein [Ferroacidibacillus organovorans]|uniref:Uncharacterized protein n=1 Tax=Ferroacidibacillus organovorans TaxID=1765683 RepID=A0A853K7M1_9BACL|nr:hypothetical protein [Ferroacidibacillus organovorans]KYP79533.1 hypothetical protein AYJ22_14485 [Ferroacidibacillus organovorans]OAG91089.1 hypothetical protein AYW79_13950 [Ferroacidibacillus organovorans]